ncbi:MAG: hypothetical protein H7X92_13640 [Chitinophagales bacterium]|nr:hypothetical protein [Hyphomicrobiales bacterium]
MREQMDTWRPLSWSALIFGAFLALAVAITLHILGAAVTASVIDPQGTAEDNFMTVGGVSGVWFLASSAIGLFVGGFVASAISHTFSGHRSAIYGLGVWALTALATVCVVVPTLVSGTSSAVRTAGTVIDRTAGALGGASGAAVQGAQNNPGLIENVQRTLIGTPAGEIDQAAVQDISSLIGQRVLTGEWNAGQRDRLIGAVARVAKIPADDARRRVDDAQNTLVAAAQRAEASVRAAAETARMGFAAIAYWGFAALALGCFSAYLGARYGELDESDLPRFARVRYANPN